VRFRRLSFCDNKYFPSWKDDDLDYLSMDLKSFYACPTQGKVKSWVQCVKKNQCVKQHRFLTCPTNK
jgi:hypothetical protein